MSKVSDSVYQGDSAIVPLTLVLVLLLMPVTSVTVVAQEQEPNDDFSSAQPVSEGNTTGQIQDGESDFFKIDANATDALDVAANPESDEITIRLYGPDRTQLARESNLGGNTVEKRIVRKAPENGTYYVEITSPGTTNYTLDVEKVTPAENDAFAPNDDFRSAATLSEGFTDAKIWGSESDFFKIDANTTDALDVAVKPESDEITIRLYGPDRTQLARKSNLGGNTVRKRIVRKAPENGTYYVEITSPGTTNYTLDAEKVTPAENDAFAPNDDFDSAVAISREFTNAKIWGGESDFFKVGLNESEGLEVTADAESDELALRVYGPDRAQLAGKSNLGGNTSPLEVTLEAAETGTYYIEVAGGNDGATTDYRLQSNRTGLLPDSDPTEPIEEQFDTNDRPGIQPAEAQAAIVALNRGEISPGEAQTVIAALNRG